ncbi:hypothetical protein [Nostoc sp. MS1]|uniref:hypothetical protein n=1 Tax=Nostoc sp. MS1 TaxID=2764711 RepID=UPI001CC55597|nr:hypothetical protein [Nostoc sp. MS1]BCL34623.1 hypothetical protein NSMS1_10700 [Nostoc sp. MS1]
MKNRIIIIGLSLLLYGIALSLPCLLFDILPRGVAKADAPPGQINAYGNLDNITEMTGIELTIAGLFGLLFFVISPSLGWLANPTYWMSCIFLARQQYKFSFFSALIAVIIGFAGTVSAFWYRLPNGSSPNSELLLNKLLPGFWFWLAAPLLIGVVSLLKLTKLIK